MGCFNHLDSFYTLEAIKTDGNTEECAQSGNLADAGITCDMSSLEITFEIDTSMQITETLTLRLTFNNWAQVHYESTLYSCHVVDNGINHDGSTHQMSVSDGDYSIAFGPYTLNGSESECGTLTTIQISG